MEGGRLIVCRVSLLDSRCSSNIIVKVVSPEASGSRSNFKVGGVKWCQLCVARRCYSTERVAIAILGPQCEVARDRTRRGSLEGRFGAVCSEIDIVVLK